MVSQFLISLSFPFDFFFFFINGNFLIILTDFSFFGWSDLLDKGISSFVSGLVMIVSCNDLGFAGISLVTSDCGCDCDCNSNGLLPLFIRWTKGSVSSSKSS